MKQIKMSGGTAEIKTVSGGKLTAMVNGIMNVVLNDAKGNVSAISNYDVLQSNGVIHVIHSVLLP